MRIASISRSALYAAIFLSGLAIVALWLHAAASPEMQALRQQRVLAEEFVDTLRDLAYRHTGSVQRARLGREGPAEAAAALQALDDQARWLDVRLNDLEAAGAGRGVTVPLRDALEAWQHLRAFEAELALLSVQNDASADGFGIEHERLTEAYMTQLLVTTRAMRADLEGRADQFERTGAVKDAVAFAAIGLYLAGLVLLLHFYVQRRVARPLEELAREAEAAASGALAGSFGWQQLDNEVGSLARRLEQSWRGSRSSATVNSSRGRWRC